MGHGARDRRGCGRCWRGRTTTARQTLRLFGIPESEIAETLRIAERDGVDISTLEVTTCLKRGEVEVVTRYEPPGEGAYRDFAEIVRERHGDTLFSEDGRTIDEIVAGLLRGDAPPARSPRPSRAPAACSRPA